MLLEYKQPPVAEEAAPKALKKYVLLGQLAKGGMAELFLARATGLGGFERLLVIKRVLPALAHDTEFVRMLLDEARIAATLQHSNIVQVFDVGMDDGNVFFAMEHLHGQHVAEIVRGAKARATTMPLENAIAIAVAVAAGLHYAHERWGVDGKPLGIVHRDISPNNVIVTYDGNVKLIDFGIAKAANNLSTTRFGLFKGKLPYASPEQCRCEPVDRRTDVYSLGVLLYELTTGHQLFVAESEFELLRLMSEAVVPRPRMRDKAYPRELEQVVLKALARDPADRYQTAEALQRDLEVFAGKARLDLSAFSLSRLMGTLFDDKLGHWQDAKRAGLTLEQHITRTTGAFHEVEQIVEPTRETPKPTLSVPRMRAVALAFGLIAAATIAGRVASNAANDELAPVAQVIAPAPSVAPHVEALPTLQVTPIEPAQPALPLPADLVAPVVDPTRAAPPKQPSTPKKHAAKRPAARVNATPAAPRPVRPALPSPRDDDDLDSIVPRSTR
jgi:serine/threonine protein kinase